MDPLSIFGLVQTCYEVGAKLIEICDCWKNAESEVQARLLKVRSCWFRSRSQVEFMRRVSAIIEDDLRRLFGDLMRQLATCLREASAQLNSVIQRGEDAKPGFLVFGGRAKKAAYVWKKEALDGIIADMEEWQSRFDPSWFLIMTIASPTIDNELRRARASAGMIERAPGGAPSAANNPLALASGLRTTLSSDAKPPSFLSSFPMETVDIPYSALKIARRTGDSKWYVVDSIDCSPYPDVKALARDVRVLAARLSQADPVAFGLLNCKGVIAASQTQQQGVPSLDSSSPPQPAGANHLAPLNTSRSISRSPSPSNYRQISNFTLLFRFPEGMEVLQSLRQMLLNSDANISLGRKVRIAREMAKSVAYVHTFDFVHKNIRPESFLCFEPPDGASSSGGLSSHAFLAGFDAFRAATGATMMHGDLTWDCNVYRHPLRQGYNPAEKYRMQHDIYSLGVCLLEVGLWEPFVEYSSPESGGRSVHPMAGKSFHHFNAWLEQKNAARQDGSKATSTERQGFLDLLAFKLKDYLVEQAETRLPARMGAKYTRVVLACLSCLDEDRYPGDDRQVAVQYIEDIMMNLGGISV
ncbi:uncharacterized protein B0I36DRAFT_363172 [Microdochium trichocladiopsis]|uniref:Protein kinase domain-containing protein n=1 Tax=Microdochium trichocladiopsis TaxID=1682393 RepID=A0A9P9BNQ8_9PEZI|nr:uncharacterized protein B0I36DRAFT_363172 [Microdochium trichocladiopsis]KAH7031486.1 hypothetical protein B0I36DRAFT_363172 [Microdochium trichocladiopsis]